MNAPRIAILAAGEKGRAFVAAMIDDASSVVVSVHTYQQTGTLDESSARIEELCTAAAVTLHRGARNSLDVEPDVDLVFVVGWQYLLPHDPRMVVFHDSLLPRLRGFAPTVTALIVGETEVGVTALRPVDEPDAGPILARHAQPLAYPAKIRDVIASLTDSYVACAHEVVAKFAAGALVESVQDEAAATYSIWRGAADYFLDWTEDAARICRTVDALGWPYEGARTRLDGEILTVLEAVPGPDLQFEITEPGKVWSLSDGMPTVVCGTGTVTLTDVRDADGNAYRFERLRVRLA